MTIILEGIDEIENEINRNACLAIIRDHKDRLLKAPGSKSKHQAWEGGWVDHTEECMRMASFLYYPMDSRRPLTFTLGDVMLILFLHDIHKPFKYVEPKSVDDDTDEHQFQQSIIEKYDFVLEDDHLNALKYIHGEGNDHHAWVRMQGPLAAFCHLCDVTSARIWHNEPKYSKDNTEFLVNSDTGSSFR